MISFEVNQHELLKALQIVASAADKKNKLPILKTVLIERAGDNLKLICNNLEHQIRSECTVISLNSELSICVNCEKLIGIVKVIPNNLIKIEINKDLLTIKSNRKKYTLKVLSSVEFPTAQIPDKRQSFKITSNILKGMLEVVSTAISVNDARFYLMGAFLELKGGLINLVGTNGHRLSLATSKLDTELELNGSIINRNSVIELIRLLPDSEELIECTISDNSIQIKCNKFILNGQLIEGKFPDYKHLIPKYNNFIIIDRKSLINSLKSLVPMVKSVDFKGASLKSKDSLLEIKVSDNLEEATDEIEILEKSGDKDLEIGISIDYLTEVIKSISSDSIAIYYNESASLPILLIEVKIDSGSDKSEPGDDYPYNDNEGQNAINSTHVIMPIRL